MGEIVVKSVEAVEEAPTERGMMFAHYLLVEGSGAPEAGKIRVLAKSNGKWKPGSKALCEVAGEGWEGPDGERDWLYCRLSIPQQEGKFGAKKSTGFSGSSSSKGSAPAAAPADRPMPTVTYTEASAAYDDFATEAAVSVAGQVEALLGNFGEAKPTPDAVLAAAAALTTAKANSLFAAYIKSFRIAYQSSKS